MYVSKFRAGRWHAYTRVHAWACETMEMETQDHASPPLLPHGFAVPSGSRGWSNSSSWTVLLFQIHTTFVWFQSQKSHREAQWRAPGPDLGSVRAICVLLIADLLFIFLKDYYLSFQCFLSADVCSIPFSSFFHERAYSPTACCPFPQVPRTSRFPHCRVASLSTSRCGCTRAHTANPAHGCLDWLQASGTTLAICTHRPMYCWEVGFWGQRKPIYSCTKI